jgi:hypothetical protein
MSSITPQATSVLYDATPKAKLYNVSQNIAIIGNSANAFMRTVKNEKAKSYLEISIRYFNNVSDLTNQMSSKTLSEQAIKVIDALPSVMKHQVFATPPSTMQFICQLETTIESLNSLVKFDTKEDVCIETKELSDYIAVASYSLRKHLKNFIVAYKNPTNHVSSNLTSSNLADASSTNDGSSVDGATSNDKNILTPDLRIALLTQENKHLKDRRICVYPGCNNQRDTILLPCGHIVYCTLHADDNAINQCPIDNKNFNNFANVFF